MRFCTPKGWIICLMVVIILVSIQAVSCEYGKIEHPSYDLIIENKTDQTLTISTNQSGTIGQVESGKKIMTKYDTHSTTILITAKNVQGEVVFSQTYSFGDSKNKYSLQDSGKSGVYICQAVIPPLEHTPGSSDNLTNNE